MDRTGTVGAEVAIPTVAIAGDPRVDFDGEPPNAGNEKNPTEVAPAGEAQPDAGPGFDSTGDAAARVDGLHPAHGKFAIDFRKAFLCGGVMEVEEFDALMRVEALYGSDAGATEAAGAVVEDEKVGGLGRRGHLDV